MASPVEDLTLAITNLNTTLAAQSSSVDSLSMVFSEQSVYFYLGVICAWSFLAGVRK